MRAWIIPHLQLLLTTLWDQVGCGAPDIDPTAVPKVSLLPAASNQAQGACWQVITLFAPTPPKVVRCQAVASDGEEHPYTQDTLTGISQVFGTHEDTDPESEPKEKIQSIQQKWHPKSLKEDSPLKESSKLSSEEVPPTDEALCNEARQKAWLLDTCLMPGVAKRLLKMSWAGPPETT